MSTPPDAELVAEARRGSAKAFAALVDRHGSVVRSFLRRLDGGWTDADDLAQEVFITAWTQLGRWRPDGSLRSWLCGVAYRKWLGHKRSRRRSAAREQAWASDGEVPPPSGAGVDAARILGQLGPEQRAAVVLCLSADFSHAEAAAALGLPLGTVKSHVTRGREKLVTLMGGLDDGR
jgi:DNA-directed RNA polymerase specialized sigma24 family protein